MDIKCLRHCYTLLNPGETHLDDQELEHLSFGKSFGPWGTRTFSAWRRGCSGGRNSSLCGCGEVSKNTELGSLLQWVAGEHKFKKGSSDRSRFFSCLNNQIMGQLDQFWSSHIFKTQLDTALGILLLPQTWP